MEGILNEEELGNGWFFVEGLEEVCGLGEVVVEDGQGLFFDVMFLHEGTDIEEGNSFGLDLAEEGMFLGFE